MDMVESCIVFQIQIQIQGHVFLKLHDQIFVIISA